MHLLWAMALCSDFRCRALVVAGKGHLSDVTADDRDVLWVLRCDLMRMARELATLVNSI
jgi:hypothetical protein